MWLVSQDGESIDNLDKFQHLIVTQDWTKKDWEIQGVVSNDDNNVTLAKYETKEQAVFVLGEIIKNITLGSKAYTLRNF